MKPLDQRQRQRLAAVRQRAHDQHRCEPKAIEENEERRVGLRVHDDSLFLIDCLMQAGAPFAPPLSKTKSERVEEIRGEARDAKAYDPDGVEKNHLAPVGLGVFADHDFLVKLIDDVTEGAYRGDKSEPDPDPAPPLLNPEVAAKEADEAGIPA
jgi:hypothetical protein